MRTTGAVWFLPALFAIASLLSAGGGTLRTGYIASDISSAGIGLSLIGPLLAAGAAYWFGGRTEFHAPLRSTRRGIEILLRTGWPLMVGGPLAGCLAVLISARVVPSDPVSWRLLLVAFAAQLACALVGMLLGWASPTVVAVPAAAMLTFVWFNYLVGTSSALLHNMTLTLDGFSQGNQPSSAATGGVLTLAGGVCISTLACVGRRYWDRTPRFLAVMLALVSIVAAVVASALVVTASPTRLNLLATQPRTETLSCTNKLGITICLWPEGLGEAGEIARVVKTLNTSLADWGLPMVSEVAQGGLRAGAVDVTAVPHMSAAQLRYSIARGYLRQRIGCQDVGGDLVGERLVLLGLASGVSDATLSDEFGAETVRRVRETVERASGSPEDVGRWYTDGLSNIGCVPGT